MNDHAENMLPCQCGGSVAFHSGGGCDGCHYIHCKSCGAMVDYSDAADPINDTETLNELRELCAERWNRRATAAQEVRQEAVGKVLSEEEMGIGYDRRAGPAIWFGKPKPGFIYTTQQPGPDVRGLVEVATKILGKLQHPTESVHALDTWNLEDALKPFIDSGQAQQGEQHEP